MRIVRAQHRRYQLPSQGGGGGGVVWRANEPAGSVLAFERRFDTTAGAFSGDLAVVSDASAPQSPPNILRATLRAGQNDQSSLYLYEDSTDEFTTAYVAYWARYSANWQGHSTGVNKEFYFWTNGDSPSMYFDASGGGNGDLTPRIETQAAIATPLGAGEVHLDPNLVPTARIIRSQWQLREIVLKANTAGNTNGACDFYLDNLHIGSYSGIQWRSATCFWDLVRQTSFWGGNTGETAPADQWIEIDHFYVSGKP